MSINKKIFTNKKSFKRFAQYEEILTDKYDSKRFS